uniref:Ig-like domain-containing protein n=1 Tax=Labrus bergylta TaxID=56723 RepID=A0A3Q3MXH6_9LABR
MFTSNLLTGVDQTNKNKMNVRFSHIVFKILSYICLLEDIRALMCSIYDFYPEKLTVKWKKNEIEETGFTTWPPKSFRNTFSAVSVLNVKNTDWESKAVYTCEVTHKGKLYMKKASKGTSLIQCYPNTAVYLLQLNCKQ